MSFQNDFWGNAQRFDAWYDIIRKIVKEIGERPDLTATEYHKLVHGRLMRLLPATARMMEAIIKMHSVDFGLNALEKFFQLPVAEIPSPDTVARQTRKVKEDLIKEGYNLHQSNANSAESFNDLMVQAEQETGSYLSGIEARFKTALRKEFRHLTWEENKVLTAIRGPFARQTRRPDTLCERITLAIEIDSLEYHLDDRATFTEDRRRIRFYQYLGYTVLPFSGPELSISTGFNNAFNEIRFYIDNLGIDNDTQNSV
jgi:hypothetical protein